MKVGDILSSLEAKKKLLLTDSKGVVRQDFMAGNGKGHASDSLTRQVPGQRRFLTPVDLERMYASNSMAKNIVDIPAEDMTRAGFTLKMKDEKKKALYESRLRQLKVKDKIKQQFIYQRLYGDGFVSIGTEEDSKFELSEPLNTGNIRKVLYLNAFSGKKISNRLIDENIFSPRYGLIDTFFINNYARNGQIQLLNDTQFIKIHHSRVLHQQDMRFEDELEGASLIESLYDVLTVVDTSLWSVGQMLYDYVFKVFKSKDVTSLTPDEKAQLGMVMDYKFRTEALAIIESEESLTKEATQATGVDSLLDFVWDYLSGAARMPKTVIKGQEAGTVTGAQYDIMNYYSRITSMQENELRPQLEYLVRLLMYASDECGGRMDPDSEEWSIEFNPLWNVDSKTDAEIRKLTAETDAIYIDRGVIDPEEVEEARFGRFGVTESSKFNADSLTDDERSRIAKDVYQKYKQDRNND